jgi:hypothetical protein
VDVEKLIGEVAARNGIRIEPDDPAFALVTLNQLVLEETVRRLVSEIRAATTDFESAVERVQSRAGSMLARELVKRPLRYKDAAPCEGRGSVAIWVSVGVLCATALLLIGGCFGHLVWPS